MARGLLARIAERAGNPSARPRVDVNRDVAEHLRALLNARQGNAAAVPALGLVDFADVVHALPGALQRLQGAIRATVLEFEPRLTNVSVRSVPSEDPLRLKFEILGELQQEGRRERLRFRTELAPGGQVHVL